MPETDTPEFLVQEELINMAKV